MTVPSEVDVIVDADNSDSTSYVDWPAIIAGVVLASAISILLLTFGSAIGLTMTDFDGEGVDPVWIAIAAALWLLWVQVSSFMAGGYITGRLRRRHANATEHESDVRDGAHGILVWAGALVLGAFLAVGGLGAAASAVGSAASTLTTAASNVADEAGGAMTDPNAYFVDALFRPTGSEADADVAATAEEAPEATEPAVTTETPAATDMPAAPSTTSTAPATTTPAATAATTSAATASANTAAIRGEAGRIFARSAVSGELPDEDRTYLVRMVATNANLSQEEAEARVDQVLANVEAARTEAEEAAETARKTGVLAAFLTAAAFLVSAVAAFWAAQKGGNHRDEGTVFADVFRRF
jgi:hypothetical protein